MCAVDVIRRTKKKTVDHTWGRKRLPSIILTRFMCQKDIIELWKLIASSGSILCQAKRKLRAVLTRVPNCQPVLICLINPLFPPFLLTIQRRMSTRCISWMRYVCFFNNIIYACDYLSRLIVLLQLLDFRKKLNARNQFCCHVYMKM